MTVLTDQSKRGEAYHLDVIDVFSDGESYYVVVQPDKQGVRNYDYYDLLAQAEEKLEDDEKLNVLLVPSVPG